MKKALLLAPLLVLLVLGVFSCKKIDKLLTFEISDSENIKIPASGLLNVPVILPVPVTARSETSACRSSR
jgi:hypothetical protein